MIASRGLIDHPRQGLADPSDQGLMAGFGVIETLPLIAREAVRFEMVLRDINLDVRLFHLLPCLCLSSGA
jgi:hypothetical protein